MNPFKQEGVRTLSLIPESRVSAAFTIESRWVNEMKN